ncbi:MAG TPA: hypothetical protein DCZ83_01465 [Candidatus Yonathbacteria bacterium]|nr:hypothetical protein [Candidatus Yonathbacteria bacterium]
MYKALIDRDSLVDPMVLSDYEILSTYEEKWEGDEPEVLHISKVIIPEGKVSGLIKILSSHGLQEGWFALVWNYSSAIVVFKDRVFTLQNKKPWNEAELSEIMEYGKKNEIDKKYFLNMRSVMDTW